MLTASAPAPLSEMPTKPPAAEIAAAAETASIVAPSSASMERSPPVVVTPVSALAM